MDEGASDWDLVTVGGLDVDLFENQVGSFGGSRFVEFFAFEELVGGFNLVRDV